MSAEVKLALIGLLILTVIFLIGRREGGEE